MKKTHVRILCLVLALCMALPLLAACGEEKETKKKNVYVPIADDDPIKYLADALDFGNQEIVISLSQYESAEIIGDSTVYIEGPDRRGANSVHNEIYDRNLRVQSALGISPRYVYTRLSYDGIMEDIVQKVSIPGPNTPDLYIDQVVGMIRAQINGYFVNVLDPTRDSHLDFGDTTKNDKGWYNPYMQTFNFSSDRRMYLLAGDYFMDVIRMLNLVGCNLSKFSQLFYDQDGTNYLYQTVQNGDWTVDKLVEWSEIAYRDTGVLSGRGDIEDQIGFLTTNTNCTASMSILPSNNVNIYSVSEDGTTFTAVPSERNSTAIDKWRNALKSTGLYIHDIASGGGSREQLTEAFTDGGVLFSSGVQLLMMETDQFQQMENNKCVLPYPKAFAADDYCVITHDNARVGGVLLHAGLDDKTYEALTAWLQAMALSSEDVLDEYYNSVLKYKLSSEYGAAMMMDIIYDSISKPYYIFEDAVIEGTSIQGDNHPTAYARIMKDTSSTYSGKYESIREAATTKMEAYVKEFNKLK